MFSTKSYGPKRVTKNLPGPKAAKLVARAAASLSPSNTYAMPLAIESAKGALIHDVDGNRFLDLAAGVAVTAAGYANPAITRAVKKQAEKFLHISGSVFYQENMIAYAEALAKRSPVKGNGDNRIFFGNSGAEAWDSALKLARWKTGRQNFIAFHGAFHGRTFGGITGNSSKIVQKKGFGPLLPGLYHAFYPKPYVCPHDTQVPTTVEGCLEYIENYVFARLCPPEEIAAIALEPIQGEGGYVVPPTSFFKALRQLCDKHGILLIVDEVQSGFGRTGKLFAIEHSGIKPDIICAAKGIASGMPLSAIIASAEVMSWPYGAHGSTYGGNPLAIEAAHETLRQLDDGLMDNATKVGEVFMSRLKDLSRTYSCLGDVRGHGLMIGIEIVKGKAGYPEPDPETRDTIVEACFQKGLVVLGCGSHSIRLCPPLVITEKQAHLACDIVEKILGEM